MFDRRLCLALAFPLVLAIALVALLAVRTPRIGVSLYGLLGREAERIPAFVRETAAREIDVIVSSADRANAESVATRIRRECAVLPAIPPGALDFVRRERAGLVSREDARLLASREGRAKIARRAHRRLYANPTPPILGFADDPFALVDSFLAEHAPVSNCLMTNGVVHILLKLAAGPAGEIPDLSAFARAGVAIRLCGSPVHTARAEARCRREVNALSAFSVVFIVFLSVFVFRSVRWIGYLLGSLTVATLSGGLLLVAVFSEIHLMSLVFGTTVLGLVVDYSFHWLLADPTQGGTTRRNLMLSFLTTEISLVPLMISSGPVLAQAAIFLGAGLCGALGYVLIAYPQARTPIPREVPRTLPRIRVRVLCLVLALLSLLGLPGLRLHTDATALYRIPDDLLSVERLKASFPSFDLTLLPSRDERQKRYANIRALYSEHADALAAELSRTALQPPPEPQFDFVPPSRLLSEMLARGTDETLVRLGCAMLCMLVAVVVFCRRQALRIIAPAAFALVAVAGLLSLSGVTLNLFHLLAGFLLAGMGVDYAVFLSSDTPSLRSVICSLLTSFVGFGALVFVSMPVAVSFGQALGLGLPICFVSALAVAPARNASVEQAASPVGLEILWAVYKILGLRFLHLLSGGVAVCAWAFSRPVRNVSPSPVTALNFACSLADRLVVMAGGRRRPQVHAEESDDARAFVNDVQRGCGVFILFPHVGSVEMLVALGACAHPFHAWMDVDRTNVFSRFYLAHVKQARVTIHPTADFDMGSVFATGDWLDAGDCVLMAGDRGDGAFRLAASFDHPVYFVACVQEKSCHYRAVIRKLPPERRTLKDAFVRCRDEVAARYPYQCYAFG